MIWLGTWYMLTDFLTDSSKPVPWISHCSSSESQKYLEKYKLLHKPWKSLVFQVHLSCLPLQGLKVVFSGSGIWPKYSVGFGKMHYILTRKGIFNYCLTKAAGFAKVWAEGAGFFFSVHWEFSKSYIWTTNTNQPGAHQAVSPFKPNYRVCLVN